MEIIGYVLVAVSLYFIPTGVAAIRHKRNAGAICILNLLLGWTVVGWVIALVWAAMVDASVPRNSSRTNGLGQRS